MQTIWIGYLVFDTKFTSKRDRGVLSSIGIQDSVTESVGIEELHKHGPRGPYLPIGQAQNESLEWSASPPKLRGGHHATDALWEEWTNAVWPRYEAVSLPVLAGLAGADSKNTKRFDAASVLNKEFSGGRCVPSMHPKHSSNGRRSRMHGGILVCIGKLRKFFRANRLGLFQKPKEK
jgi:hypothetical protein